MRQPSVGGCPLETLSSTRTCSSPSTASTSSPIAGSAGQRRVGVGPGRPCPPPRPRGSLRGGHTQRGGLLRAWSTALLGRRRARTVRRTFVVEAHVRRGRSSGVRGVLHPPIGLPAEGSRPALVGLLRLSGARKAALVEIQADEYGNGRVGEAHADLFADLLDALGIDPTYGAYIDEIPAVSLATGNFITLLGSHRRLRSALLGHLAGFEMTSVTPMSRYAAAGRRLGLGAPVGRFYDVHVRSRRAPWPAGVGELGRRGPRERRALHSRDRLRRRRAHHPRRPLHPPPPPSLAAR